MASIIESVIKNDEPIVVAKGGSLSILEYDTDKLLLLTEYGGVTVCTDQEDKQELVDGELPEVTKGAENE
jgi:uncharacterized protein YuzB (UPF0349 family)